MRQNTCECQDVYMCVRVKNICMWKDQNELWLVRPLIETYACRGALQSVVSEYWAEPTSCSTTDSCWALGSFKERAEGKAGASEGLNTRCHTGFCSDLELFTGGKRAQSLFFKLLGEKSGFIFSLTSQPVCSSEPRHCRPPLWVL